MIELPDCIEPGRGPGYHLVFIMVHGVPLTIGSLPYQHPDGTLNPPKEVAAWAQGIGTRYKRHPSTQVPPDAPVGVYSGDTGERLVT